MEIQKSSKVQVNFISESRTEFSGKVFKGIGIVDLIEDGRVFGKLLNGTPFMCSISDVSPYVENLSPNEASFQECYLTAGGKQIELEKEEGAYTHSKSQMAWEIWQAKANAVPEGFVLVDEDVLEEIKDSFSLLQEDIALHRDFGTEFTAKRDFNEVLERVTKLKAMIETQEPSND